MRGRGNANEKHLAIIRRAYARQMLALVGVDNPVLEEAFAAIPRERFIGPPPWHLSRGGVGALVSGDPSIVYQDVLIALAPERGVNNGSPSLHALWLDRLAPRPGDRIVHIGAGTGYYTAILARLVGPDGRVTAVEVDPNLAEQARANLGDCANVEVVEGDGAQWPRDEADCVYVNFAVVRPAEAWLTRLAPGGRLIFPLGVPSPARGRLQVRHSLHGAGFLVERRRDGFAVSWLGGAYFVCAEGPLAGTPDEQRALLAAFDKDSAEFVRSLWLGSQPPSQRDWLSGEGWGLSYDEVAG